MNGRRHGCRHGLWGAARTALTGRRRAAKVVAGGGAVRRSPRRPPQHFAAAGQGARNVRTTRSASLPTKRRIVEWSTRPLRTGTAVRRPACSVVYTTSKSKRNHQRDPIVACYKSNNVVKQRLSAHLCAELIESPQHEEIPTMGTRVHMRITKTTQQMALSVSQSEYPEQTSIPLQFSIFHRTPYQERQISRQTCFSPSISVVLRMSPWAVFSIAWLSGSARAHASAKRCRRPPRVAAIYGFPFWRPYQELFDDYDIIFSPFAGMMPMRMHVLDATSGAYSDFSLKKYGRLDGIGARRNPRRRR